MCDPTCLVALCKRDRIGTIIGVGGGQQQTVTTVLRPCPGWHDIQAGNNGDAAAVGLIDDPVKPRPIVAVGRTWLCVCPGEQLDNPRRPELVDQIELAGEVGLVRNATQTRVYPCFGNRRLDGSCRRYRRIGSRPIGKDMQTLCQ